MENSVPYHCPKCRSSGEQAVFPSLPELRQHVLKFHLNAESSVQSPSSSSSSPPQSDLNLPKATVPSLSSALFAEARSVTRGPSEAEQLAQAKRYLMREAVKASEQSRQQIRRLNEQIKIKETDLDSAIKRLDSMDERNRGVQEEFKMADAQSREVRRELEELKAKLAEKEKLLEQKDKELAEQMNYMKSMEEKEAAAKEKLERTVEKIIARAEMAERNLELMKLSKSSAASRDQEREVDFAQRNSELRDILDSCNAASNATHKPVHAATVNQNPAAPHSIPLVQIYLRNFMEKYKELRARDFAFEQAVPVFPGLPQVFVDPLDLEERSSTVQRTRAERDVLNPVASRVPKPIDVYSDEGDASLSMERRPSAKNNVNNNNNSSSYNYNNSFYNRNNHNANYAPNSPNSKWKKNYLSTNGHPTTARTKHSPMWSDYEDNDDDDDEPLTEVSDDLEEEKEEEEEEEKKAEEDHVPSGSKHDF